MDLVLKSEANTVLSKYSPSPPSRMLFNRIRQSANIEEACKKRIHAGLAPFVEQCKANLLFNLEKDPCEFDNVEAQHPSVVTRLMTKLHYFEPQTIPMQLFPADPRADPSRFRGYWSWWLDSPEDLNGVGVLCSGMVTLVAIALYKFR